MEEEGAANAFPAVPPPLPYSLRDRKRSIAIFWTLFILDTLAQPLVLYWALWYATDLSHNLGMFDPFLFRRSLADNFFVLSLQSLVLSPRLLAASQSSSTSIDCTIFSNLTLGLGR